MTLPTGSPLAKPNPSPDWLELLLQENVVFSPGFLERARLSLPVIDLDAPNKPGPERALLQRYYGKYSVCVPSAE